MSTPSPILFYEEEYYFLSNFSAFGIDWKDKFYMTSEHVYQAEKFLDENIQEKIRVAKSAYDAKRIAKENKDSCRKDWEEIKLEVMKNILIAKIDQHDYIKHGLLKSGTRILVENSSEDDFWGWGPNKDGANHLGKLWMELRDEVGSKEE